MTHYLLGASTCGLSAVDEALFRTYRDAGIDCMEISVPMEDYAALDFTKIAVLSAAYEIPVRSLHLPFDNVTYNYASFSFSVRDNTLRTHTELLRKAAGSGIHTFVVHPSSEPIEDADRGALMELSAEGLTRLCDVATEEGAVLAVENLPRTCLCRNSDEMLRLLSADGRLMSCFDTNHLLCEEAVHYLSVVGSRVVTIHVSDYDFINERHWLPGKGKIDWKTLFDTLRAQHYPGPLMLEVKRADGVTEADFRPAVAQYL